MRPRISSASTAGPLTSLMTSPGALGLFGSFYMLAKGNIAAHRQIMQYLYIGACVVAGAFTLLPNRFLGHLVIGQWLGLA